MEAGFLNQHSWIQQQYDLFPYPDHPIETPVTVDPNFVANHCLKPVYELKGQPDWTAQGKTILDAGCGTGWAALALAAANPGAKVVGIDLSPNSIQIAQQRFQYHGVAPSLFQVLAIEDLPSLGLEFDYINCDQALFFLPDPLVGLQTMRQVLKPGGILRANLHSAYQRIHCFRAQEAFRVLGLLHDEAGSFEAAIATELMDELKDDVDLKVHTWQALRHASESEKQCFVMRDFLVQGDKGYTIPDLFQLLDAAQLEFVSMVNGQDWQLLNLFQEVDNPPAYMGYAIAELSQREQLHLYELFNPVHRLLDFWCTRDEF